MLHSKQWHYSLHRDFQNCYSTRRSPTGFFSSNSTKGTHTTSNIHHYIQRILHPESNSTCRRQRALQVLHFSTRNSTHRRQGDLLEIHPCAPNVFQRHSRHSSRKTFQRHSRYSRHSSHSWHSSLSRHFYKFQLFPGILQLECIFYSLIGFHRNSTEYQLKITLQTFYKHYILQRKGDVAISVKVTLYSE